MRAAASRRRQETVRMTMQNKDKAGGKELFPVLPLRDIVVFPHMIVPLFVGRDKSVAALEAMAMRPGSGAVVTIVDPTGRSSCCAAVCRVSVRPQDLTTAPSRPLPFDLRFASATSASDAQVPPTVAVWPAGQAPQVLSLFVCNSVRSK